MPPTNPLGRAGPPPTRQGTTVDRKVAAVASPKQLFDAIHKYHRDAFEQSLADDVLSFPNPFSNKLDPGKWASTMVAIALAESGGRMNAKNSYVVQGKRHYVYGPWQISDIHTDCHGGNVQRLMTDLDFSAKVAACVHKKQGLSAWSVYKSGAWEKFKDKTKGIAPSVGEIIENAPGELVGGLGNIDWGPILMVAGGSLCIVFGVVFLATEIM